MAEGAGRQLLEKVFSEHKVFPLADLPKHVDASDDCLLPDSLQQSIAVEVFPDFDSKQLPMAHQNRQSSQLPSATSGTQRRSSSSSGRPDWYPFMVGSLVYDFVARTHAEIICPGILQISRDDARAGDDVRQVPAVAAALHHAERFDEEDVRVLLLGSCAARRLGVAPRLAGLLFDPPRLDSLQHLCFC